MKFEPKKVICTQNSLTYRYECKNIQKNELGHQINNAYRFLKGVPYSIKNQADYEEIISLNIFEDYVEPVTNARPERTETTKQRKLREKAEAKANKEAAEKAKAEATGDEVIEEEAVDEIVEDGAEPSNPDVEDNSEEIKEEEY